MENHLLTRSLLPLTGKLNKYLINIIDQYSFLNIDNIIEKNYRTREYTYYIINNEITIEDIVIKANHRGYRGFFISLEYEFLKENIEKIMNDNIKKIFHLVNKQYLYCFKNDKRDLFFIDIIKLDHVLLKISETINN